MKILIAKTAGFCFGVNNAVNTVYEQLKNTDNRIYTMGPIIHNEQVVKQLSTLGVKVAEDVDFLEAPGIVVIRAHGVTPCVYERIKEKNLKVVDATCPYVKKIHNLVKEQYNSGYYILLQHLPLFSISIELRHIYCKIVDKFIEKLFTFSKAVYVAGIAVKIVFLYK